MGQDEEKPHLMGAWASVRNVAGPFRSHGAPAAVIKPAA
jgi:hypothetical protein